MIHLTSNILAVEVPNDATDVSIGIGLGEDIELTWMSESCGYDIIVIDENWVFSHRCNPSIRGTMERGSKRSCF